MAQPAPLYRAILAHLGSRFGKALLLAVASSSLLVAGGCDTSSGKADKEVGEKLKTAQAKIDAELKAPSDTNQDLKQISSESDDSDPMKIHAKVSFADSELRLAELMAGKVAANDMQIDRLTHEISILAGQISDNNELAASFQQSSPEEKGKKAVDALSAAQQALASGSDGTWIKTDGGMLQSLAAVDKTRDDLQGQIDGLTKSIAASTDERNKLLDESDKLKRASEDTSSLGANPTPQARLDLGQKSVELYTQGAEARKKAAELSVKIDEDNARLARAQADLAVQQALHDSLTATRAALEAKAQEGKDSWTATQAEMARVDDRSKAILGVNPVDAPKIDSKGDLKTQTTIGSKEAAIAQLVADNVKPRADAIAHFDKAISVYQEAGVLAKSVQADLQKKSLTDPTLAKPEQVAWKAEMETFDPNLYAFMQGAAELEKANLLAQTAAEAKARLDQITMLKPILAAAHLQPLVTMDETQPTNLAQLIKSSQGDANSGARGSFTKAGTLLQHVFTSTAPLPIRSGALADEVYLEDAWASLEALAGDPQQAATHLSNAREHVAAAANQQINLPSLPADLASGASMAAPMPVSSGSPAATGVVNLVGTYKSIENSAHGTEANTFVLSADGSLTNDAILTDTAGKKTVLKAKGTWTIVPGNKVRLAITSFSANGVEQPPGELPPPQDHKIADGGKQLVPPDNSPPLVKQ